MVSQVKGTEGSNVDKGVKDFLEGLSEDTQRKMANVNDDTEEVYTDKLAKDLRQLSEYQQENCEGIFSLEPRCIDKEIGDNSESIAYKCTSSYELATSDECKYFKSRIIDKCEKSNYLFDYCDYERISRYYKVEEPRYGNSGNSAGNTNGTTGTYFGGFKIDNLSRQFNQANPVD